MANTLFHYAITEQLPNKPLNFLCLGSHLRPKQPPTKKVQFGKKILCKTNKAKMSGSTPISTLVLATKPRDKHSYHTELTYREGWILNSIAEQQPAKILAAAWSGCILIDGDTHAYTLTATPMELQASTR